MLILEWVGESIGGHARAQDHLVACNKVFATITIPTAMSVVKIFDDQTLRLTAAREPSLRTLEALPPDPDFHLLQGEAMVDRTTRWDDA